MADDSDEETVSLNICKPSLYQIHRLTVIEYDPVNFLLWEMNTSHGQLVNSKSRESGSDNE